MAISVATGLMTAYFWLVAARDGRPRVDVRWLGVKDTYPVTVEPEPAPAPPPGADADGPPSAAPARYVGVLAQFWVSNLSTLPNAVLGVRLQVRDRNGRWVGSGTCPSKQTNAYKEPNELPVSLPPRDLVKVAAYVWLPVAKETLDRFREERTYWPPFAASAGSPVEFRVEVLGLNGKTFTARVVVPEKT